jgi:hypothetical protein
MKRYDPKKANIEDEVLIKKIDDWEITASKSRKRIYIQTTSYHPPKLGFTRKDLQGLLNTMDNMIR